MKLRYFCGIGAELKRQRNGFDYMNQLYLYVLSGDETLAQVIAPNFFNDVTSSLQPSDIINIYSSADSSYKAYKVVKDLDNNVTLSELNESAGVSWRGQWQPETDYKTNELVQQNDILYISKVDHTSSLVFEDDILKWTLLAITDKSMDTLSISAAVAVVDLLNNINYLADSSTAVIDQVLPEVIAGDKRAYYFTLQANSNHLNFTIEGGQCFNCSGNAILEVSMSTPNSTIRFQANGVNGYDIVEDTRLYSRINDVVADKSLTSGFESGGLYIGNIPDSTDVTITLPVPDLTHIGDYSQYIKKSGVNSQFIIKTADDSFNQTITSDDTGFTINTVKDSLGDPVYTLTQDNRPAAYATTLQFIPTGIASVIDASYLQLQNSVPVETIVSSIDVASSDPNAPTSLGFWIDEDIQLAGTLPATDITALGVVLLTGNTARPVQMRFRYFVYDLDTNTLGALPILTTDYSSSIENSITYEQKTVIGVLPEQSWDAVSTNNALVIELQAVHIGTAGGGLPALNIKSGGSSTSKTFINVPSANVSHDSLGGKHTAGTGIEYGHVNNYKPLQNPELTTTERDAVASPNAGMVMLNTTLSKLQMYLGAVWDTIATLGKAQEFTKTQNFNATTLTDAVTIAWDAESNQVASVTLASNRTLGAPTNLVDGATYILTVKQDATGTRTLAYNAVFKFPAGEAPTLSTAVNAVDILTFVSDGTNMYGVSQLEFS